MTLKEKINRNEFLKKMGFRGASLLAVYGLGTACKPIDNPYVEPVTTTPVVTTPTPIITPPVVTKPVVTTPASTNSTVLLTLNLTDTANVKLKTAGGYVINGNVIVAKNKTNEYIATTLICSHEDEKKMTFRNEEWFCTEHDGRFAQNGTGLNKEGSKGTPVYKTSVSGDILTISK